LDKHANNNIRLNRRQEILDAAAKFFKEKGYAGTAMRDIAEHADVKTASLYYHFPSKAELLLAVYEASANLLTSLVVDAIKDEREPWARLQIACATHLQSILEGSDYVQVVSSDLPTGVEPELRARLTKQRDAYENLFRAIIAELPLPRGASKKYLLLTLLGALAWTRVWYKPGGDSPSQIARNMVEIIKRGYSPLR
jgi:TetR/AcrR family transcriptional regulator, cholesterol catabolism regulator